MLLKEIINLIQSKYPLSLQDVEDESGLRYTPSSKLEVTGVAICLDVDEGVIEVAIRNEINLIISHHPIFLKHKEYKAVKYDRDILALLKKRKIALVSFHSNIDNSNIGISNFVAKELGLLNIKSIGRTGIVTGRLNSALKVNVWAGTIKNKFSLERIIFNKIAGSVDGIRSVAICAGSGFNTIRKNLSQLHNIDLFMSGDLKYHDWKFAEKHKLNFMDVGHDIENAFINLIANILAEEYKSIKIQRIPSKTGILVI